MNRLTPQDRGIMLAGLPTDVKNYIAELELELDRVTTRQARLRKNIRSMQNKLELVNLQSKVMKLASQYRLRVPA